MLGKTNEMDLNISKSIECFDLRDFESESIIKILLNTFILVLAS